MTDLQKEFFPYIGATIRVVDIYSNYGVKIIKIVDVDRSDGTFLASAGPRTGVVWVLSMSDLGQKWMYND